METTPTSGAAQDSTESRLFNVETGQDRATTPGVDNHSIHTFGNGKSPRPCLSHSSTEKHAAPDSSAARERLPGSIPTAQKSNDVTIRAYTPADDPQLMELERLCPRGEPRPFVHFRRRFIDRAMLYTNPYLFIAEKNGMPVGVTSIAIKDTHIGGDAVRVAYSFDTRVHPRFRRQGIANAMQEEKLAFLRSQGVHGMYAYVVSTNFASIKMLEKIGVHKVRMILYLNFTPYPIIIPPMEDPQEHDEPNEQALIDRIFGERDLYIASMAQSVASYSLHRYTLDRGDIPVGISIFDQSLVYQQISADEPWPSEEEISKRARTLRVFNETGIKDAEGLRTVFDHVRDIAVVSNVSHLSWIIDRSDPVPGFLFEEATAQKDYWMMFEPLLPDWEPQWTNKPIYIDARDL
ncbi:MAG: GNAT family N-acetyltransferase [Chloroflexi bacterium]|nr:GNAT family N-acetyltransferase [Chloroflexota bacterium]